jgi:FMN phosphatase YigB (HAD superfamily)
MDRNFCVPDGKIAALFVDIDGTCTVCQPYFDEAAESFAYFMSLRGFDADQAREHLAKLNHSMTEEGGFERELFGKILIETYRQLVKAQRRRFSASTKAKDEAILRSLGMGPFFREPQVFPNARPVLNRAQHSFLMIAVSIGSRDAQKYKVSAAGLSSVFDYLIVTSRDDKVEIVRQVIEELNIDPHLSAFIGNSPRSDGACLAATNFVLLPLEKGWAFDVSRDLPQDTGFKLYRAADWRDAEERGINGLLRQRKMGKRATNSKDGAAAKACSCR